MTTPSTPRSEVVRERTGGDRADPIGRERSSSLQRAASSTPGAGSRAETRGLLRGFGRRRKFGATRLASRKSGHLETRVEGELLQHVVHMAFHGVDRDV